MGLIYMRSLLLSFYMASSCFYPALAQSSISDLTTLAEESIAQNDYARAAQLLKDAVRESEISKHGRTELNTLEKRLADAYCHLGKVDKGRLIYQRLLQAEERRAGKGSAALIPLLIAIGSTYEATGDYTEAETFYQRAFRISTNKQGPAHPDTGRCLSRIGQVRVKQDKTEQAIIDLRRAMSILQSSLGADHSESVTCVRQLIAALLKGNHEDEAKVLLQRIRSLPAQQGEAGAAAQSNLSVAPVATNQTAGEQTSAWSSALLAQQSSAAAYSEASAVESRAAANVLNSNSEHSIFSTLAERYFSATKGSGNESLYKKTLDLDIGLLGSDSPVVAGDMTNLASLYLSQGRAAEAAALLDKVASIYSQNYGKNNILVIKSERLLGSAFIAQGNFVEAERVLAGCRDAAMAEMGVNNIETAWILNQLGYAYFRAGKYELAAKTYELALTSSESVFGNDNKMVSACISDYLKVLKAQNNQSDYDKLAARLKRIEARYAEAGASGL